MELNHRLQRDLLLADFVIYQSAFSKRMADHFLYNRRERFAVIHNGVDLKRFQPRPRRAGRTTLLSAGTLRNEYMLGSVLPVFDRLWRLYDLNLLIVGSLDEICRRQVEEYIGKHPETVDRIKVTGFIDNDDLPAWLQQADLMVHPRLGDGCPNAVIESMACGLPVICGSWGGAAELVGEAGAIVPTGEWTYGEEYASGLCRATEIVLGDLEGYRQRARARAEELFDIRNVAGHYMGAMGIGDGQKAVSS
jgi:glycosyltransferase involved in cell wall biosynthesis